MPDNLDDGGKLPSLLALVGPIREQLRLEDGESYLDMAGPALYIIAAVPYTLTVCRLCRHVGLLPSIPKRPVLYWSCPQGHRYRLEPPLAVLAAAIQPVRPS